jgi:hypothetical protein
MADFSKDYAKVVLSTDIKPSGGFLGDKIIESDTGHVFEWDGDSWLQRTTAGAAHTVPTDTSGNPVNLATEATVSQLIMAITNAINETTYDLNAAAFNETTNITNDYELDNVEFNFSTAEARTITVTTDDGTVILNEEDNTDISFAWQPSSEMGFDGGDNLTVKVTQFSSAGTMDCILKIKQGSNALGGDPVVLGEDQILGGNQPIPVDRGGRYVPIISAEHTRIHESLGFTCTGKSTVANAASFDILIKNPAGNFPHFRFYAFSSDGAPSDVFLYEGTTVSGDGDACNIYNNNRNSGNTPNPSLFSEPTVTDDGVEIEYSLILGSKQTGGSAESVSVEWILKPDENYLIRYTNNSGQSATIGYHVFFYDTSL